MHKGWVRIDAEREAEFWKAVGRPEKYRYIEETDDKAHISSAWVEFWEDIRDETDEPEVDGLYKDKDGDLWLRLNGHWTTDETGLSNLTPWDEEYAEYMPFDLIDPSNY